MHAGYAFAGAVQMSPQPGSQVVSFSPATHALAAQLSLAVQALPSSHGSSLAACVQPKSAMQPSVVQTLASSHAVGVPTHARDAARDQLARTTLLALASDWAFMVSKDSAAGYARDRHARHHRDARVLADLVERGDVRAADSLAARLRSVDGPFGHLDARLLVAER